MTVTIKWKDNSTLEKGHRIYKSSTYFTSDNLPAPLVDLSPDIEEYEDTASNAGENWYIVSAYILDYEVFSEPFIPGFTTAFTHDIFRDGSALATYNFDGDATDLGGNYDGIESNNVTYTSSLIGSGYKPSINGSSGSYIDLGKDITMGDDVNTFSFWIDPLNGNYYANSTSNPVIFAKAISGGSATRFSLGFLGSTREIRLILAENTYTTGIILDANKWSHVVFYIDFVNNIQTLYINSAKAGDYTYSVGKNSNYSFLIGAYNNSSGNVQEDSSPEAVIDQFRIFNRALTQEEVDILYQEGLQS